MMMITTASNIGNIKVETILLQKKLAIIKIAKTGGGGDLESCHWSRGSVTSVAQAAQADRQSSGQS